MYRILQTLEVSHEKGLVSICLIVKYITSVSEREKAVSITFIQTLVTIFLLSFLTTNLSHSKIHQIGK